RHPGLRRHAVRLAEQFLAEDPDLGAAIARLTDDADSQVRLQVAYSLGAWRGARAGSPLASLALEHWDDPHLVRAVLSSVNKESLADVLAEVFAAPTPSAPLVRPLLEVATALGEKPALVKVLGRMTTADTKGHFAAWQMTALAELLDALVRRKQSLEKI